MRHLARVLALPCLALAQKADTVLINGKIVSVDGKESIHQAMAIREDRIVAVGKTGGIRSLAGKHTRVIDLDGRTVIPGLIDSHMHAIRAALSFSTEVHWFGAASVEEAVGRVREAAAKAAPGARLIVAGGLDRSWALARGRLDLIFTAPCHCVCVVSTGAQLQFVVYTRYQFGGAHNVHSARLYLGQFQ